MDIVTATIHNVFKLANRLPQQNYNIIPCPYKNSQNITETACSEHLSSNYFILKNMFVEILSFW